MSALNVWISEERAVMLTDTVIYDGSGRITGFDKKAVPVESWNGVISFRGNTWGLLAAVQVAEQFASFDEFIARSGAILESGHREAEAAGNLHYSSIVEIVVAGWSESRRRAMAFGLSNAVEPSFVWSDICEGEESGFAIGPNVDTALEDWRLHRVGADVLDYEPADFDPIRHGLPLMEAQRRGKTDPRFFAGEPFHCVGGSVWCSIVTRDGVDQTVLHDWHDKVGMPIVPAKVNDNLGPKIAPSFVPDKDRLQWFTLRAKGLIDPVTLMPRKLARAG